MRFLVVGVIATAMHYGLYTILRWFMYVNMAYTIGYLVSFVANFYLSAYFTFRRKPSWGKAMRFGGAHLCNYLLHILLLNLFLYIGVPEAWAPIPVFGIAIPVNFLLVRFVFKKQ